ncbi:MAG: tetratricopeptide repeat protein [Candidatus Hodarchaeales archaeon]|jgi:tetratricopeptide (TPR) repeat protein/sporulation protein YlmC with PRC-barrel domain
MIFDEKEFHLGELMQYMLHDKEGKVIGQINDVLLSTDDLTINKLIISQDLYEFKSSFINTSDIVNEEVEKKQFTIYCGRSEVQDAKLQDFWDISEDRGMILFSKLKNLPIIDINSQEHQNKVVDIIVRGSKGKDPRILIIDGGFFVSANLIRTISHEEIALAISNDHLATISNIPEESYHGILIDPDREIGRLDINNPDWSIINKLIVLGYIESVEQLLTSWLREELPEELKPALYYYLGKSYLEWGELQQSIGYFTEVLYLADQSTVFDDQLLLGRACTQLGRALVVMGNLDEAESTLTRATIILDDLQYSVYRSIAYIWLGRINWLRGTRQKAKRLFKKAQDLSEIFNSPKTIAYSLENLGIIYREENDLDKAIEYFQKGIATLRSDYPRTTASLISNMAITYYEKGLLGKSLEIQFESLVIREKLGNLIDVADSVLNITRVEAAMGSLSPSSSILSYLPIGPSKHTLLQSYRNIVEGLLMKVSKKWDEAIMHFKEALCPNLDFHYQVWVYEYICEAMIMKWKESSDEKILAELKDRLSKARDLTMKNKLYSYTCKSDLLLALLSLYCKEFDSAEYYYQDSLDIAKNHNLLVNERIAKKRLKALPAIVEKFNSSDHEEIAFLKQQIIMEMLLYGRHLRVVHLF